MKDETAADIKGDRCYSSPLVKDGLIYAVNLKAEFSVIDVQTGKLVCRIGQ